MYESKKQSLLTKLTDTQSFEERKPVLDDFFSSLEKKSFEVKESEGYKNLKQLQATNTNTQSPGKSEQKKQTSPQKSPLRKSKTQHMVSPAKTSKSGMSKENSVSPVKDQISTG